MEKETLALKLIENIDFEQLRADKMKLLAMDGDNEFKGILALIDAIQDFTVDTLGRTATEIFHLFKDKNHVIVEKGMTVDVDETEDTVYFQGTVSGFRGDHVLVEDQSENVFCMKAYDLEVVPEEDEVFEEEQQWNVPVTRIGYGYGLMAVSAFSEQEAIDKAIDEAGGESYSENSSEYIAPDGAHRISDKNK